jgi:hypothetical protein
MKTATENIACYTAVFAECHCVAAEFSEISQEKCLA